MGETVDIQELWKQVNETLHQGDINRTLWDAAAAAVPLALEDDVLILGMATEKFVLASYLETQVNRSRVRAIMHQRTGRRLDLRVIEGDTPQAYEGDRARRQSMTSEVVSRAETARISRGEAAGWEDLSEQLYLKFAEVKTKRHPQNMARFLWEVLPMVIAADERLRAEQPGLDAVHDRHLGRMMDKLGTYADLPATVVAMEFLRLKGQGK